jgi:hypothetical protein
MSSSRAEAKRRHSSDYYSREHYHKYKKTYTLSANWCPYQRGSVERFRCMFLSSFVILTPNGQFLDCVTTAFSQRYCLLWPVRLYDTFCTLSHNRHDFWKRVTEEKMCFDFAYKFRLKIFHILRRIQGDTFLYVQRSLCKVCVILVTF